LEAKVDDNCILELCDPEGLPVAQAIQLARAVSRIEPNLAPSLGAYIYHLAETAESDARVMQRALEVLCAVSDPRSFAATCRRVAQSGHPVTGCMVRWLAPRRMSRTPYTCPI
jgi:hypothetical protein